jgi:Tfp pilus assembly protein PilF
VAPTFAAAHAAMARARDAALRALELDPDHGEAHLALADVRRMLGLDWRGAESSYARALALNPAYDGVHRSYGLMLSGFARHADAIRESERARELDPSCLIVATSDAWMRYAAGDYEAAIARCARTIDLDTDYLMPRRVLGAAYLAAGREADAVAALEAAVAVDGDDPVVLSWLAHAKAVTGARAEATALLDRARSNPCATSLRSTWRSPPSAWVTWRTRSPSSTRRGWIATPFSRPSPWSLDSRRSATMRDTRNCSSGCTCLDWWWTPNRVPIEGCPHPVGLRRAGPEGSPGRGVSRATDQGKGVGIGSIRGIPG